jgi:hypothetical protein
MKKETEYRKLLEAVLRLRTILTYEENIPPEHQGEAIAINNLFYKIEHTLADGNNDDEFCQCSPQEKHGSTTAWHCNHCGKPEQSETWLKSNPNPQT